MRYLHRFEVVAVNLCFAALCLTALGACSSVDPLRVLRLGASSRSDIVANQGPPTRVWPDADGGSTLEYAEQPFGQRCFMFKLDSQGKLLAFRNALSAIERDRVQVGMSTDDIQRLLGQERSRVFFTLSEEDVWDWNVEPEQAGALRRFNVHFKAGRVLRTSYSLVFRERSIFFKD